MRRVFLYGTLLHDPLRRIVLGEDAPVRRAALPGCVVNHAGEASYPMIGPGAGAAEGLLAEVTDTAIARMDYYEGAFGYDLCPVSVIGEGQETGAETYFPADPGPAGAPWNVEDWAAKHGDIACRTAVHAMAEFGRFSSADLAANFTMMGRRATAELREQSPRTTFETALSAADVTTLEDSRDWSFFAFETQRVRYRQFDGSMGEPVLRAGLIVGEAAVILPYDPVNDRVLLVEQFRFAPHLLRDPNPWSLEAPAGLVDPGETPEDTAIRELREETGVEAGTLEVAARCYSSPGSLAEFIHVFIGLTDLPETIEGTGGLDSEHEDIRSHIVGYPAFERLIDEGTLRNAPLLIAALWLKLNRTRLRAA